MADLLSSFLRKSEITIFEYKDKKKRNFAELFLDNRYYIDFEEREH